MKKSVGKLDHFDIVIGLRGVLDVEQRWRLLEIADKCPAYKTLLEEMMISTRLEDA